MRTAAQQHWDTLENGDLLSAAEAAGFEVFLITDKNMRYQQNLAGRTIAVPATPALSSRRKHGAYVVLCMEAHPNHATSSPTSVASARLSTPFRKYRHVFGR